MTRGRKPIYTFSAAERAQIIDAYESGASLKQIAAEFGCSVDPIARTLHDQNVAMRNAGTPHERERNAKVVRLVDAGYSFGQIAADMGLSRQRVHQIYKREMQNVKNQRDE